MDFEFAIRDTVFNKLWFLVNGICPNVARFATTMSVQLGKIQQWHVKWQESKCESVERAFGVPQRKFQIHAKPSELWFSNEIREAVHACIILHNMMVEAHMEMDDREDEEHCDQFPPGMNEDGSVGRQPGTQTRVDMSHSPQSPTFQWAGQLLERTPTLVQSKEAPKLEFKEHQDCRSDLCNEEAHFKLRDSIACALEDRNLLQFNWC